MKYSRALAQTLLAGYSRALAPFTQPCMLYIFDGKDEFYPLVELRLDYGLRRSAHTWTSPSAKGTVVRTGTARWFRLQLEIDINLHEDAFPRITGEVGVDLILPNVHLVVGADVILTSFSLGLYIL